MPGRDDLHPNLYYKGRLVRGWEKAMEHPFYVGDVPYFYPCQMADILGIGRAAIKTYMNQKKASLQETYDHFTSRRTFNGRPLLPNQNVYVCKGIKCGSLREVGELLGIDSTTLAKVAERRGISKQEAINLYESGEIKRPNRWPNGGIELFGIPCLSASTAAELLHMTEGSLFAVASRENVSAATYAKSLEQKYILGHISKAALGRARPDLRPMAPKYCGRDGKNYFLITCPVCSMNLLLAPLEILQFEHSEEFCKEHEEPL